MSAFSACRLVSGARNGKGYFCTYTPVELLHASRFISVRIMEVEREPDKILEYFGNDFIGL